MQLCVVNCVCVASRGVVRVGSVGLRVCVSGCVCVCVFLPDASPHRVSAPKRLSTLT